jgi:hypothetical protein
MIVKAFEYIICYQVLAILKLQLIFTNTEWVGFF